MMIIEPGRNVWVWSRTDRDAPTAEQAMDSAASVMARTLRETPTLVSVSLPGGAKRYALNAARPMDIAIAPERPSPLPVPREMRQSVEDQPQAFAVRATNPLFVVVDFDWRGPRTTLDEWPRRAVDSFGFPVDRPMELDWLLLDSYWLGPALREDTTSGDLLRSHLPDPEQFGGGIGLIVIVGLGLLLFSKGKL
jgi:hypothetical protein